MARRSRTRQRCPVRPGSGRATACGPRAPERSGGRRRARRSAWLSRGALPRDRTGVPGSPGGRGSGATAAVIGRQWTTRGLCRGREGPRRRGGAAAGPPRIRGHSRTADPVAALVKRADRLPRPQQPHRSGTTCNRRIPRPSEASISRERPVSTARSTELPLPERGMWFKGFSDALRDGRIPGQHHRHGEPPTAQAHRHAPPRGCRQCGTPSVPGPMTQRRGAETADIPTYDRLDRASRRDRPRIVAPAG